MPLQGENELNDCFWIIKGHYYVIKFADGSEEPVKAKDHYWVRDFKVVMNAVAIHSCDTSLRRIG